MGKSFDLAVIGTGVAAGTIAGTCREAGWSVAVIDELPFGGTCALRGCDPKKVLRRGAEVVAAARALRGKGIADPGAAIDWPALMAFKRSFTDPVPANRERGFAEQGIAAFKGRARFVGANELAVGDVRIAARHIAVAAGAKPVPLAMPGAEHVVTSDAFLALERLPPRIVFIGGGYVSFEFAHIAVRAGAAVVMLDRGERPLMGFDADLVARLCARTRDLGIDFRAAAAVEAVERVGSAFRVAAKVDGVSATFDADLVVHGAGRVPAVDGLDLDKGGVRAGPRGIAVNEFMQSVSNPAVYAAGDVAAKPAPPLTPVAGIEGEAAAANLLRGNHARPDYAGIPSVVFTIPELVRIGLDADEARRQGLAFTVHENDMGDWYSVRRMGEDVAAAKVLVEDGSGRILGVHLLGPEASEQANLFALAMRSGLTAAHIKNFASAYPSMGSDIGYLV